jgi:hypothetical protein
LYSYMIAGFFSPVNNIKRFCVNTASWTHSLNAWYYASKLLSETVCYFFDV